MTADIARQLQALCRAVLMGGGLGVLYDLMRIARRRIPSPLLAGILDFLFWITATAALFLFSHENWHGQVRLYGAFFCLLGAAAYFQGISPLVMRLLFLLTGLAGHLLGVLTFPGRILVSVFKRFGKFAKTSFLSRKNGV
jgi:spore cortex biosynthesis protein YabQ